MEVEIPSDVYVPCPMVKFKNRRVTKCEGCSHFGGLMDCIPQDQGEAPFVRRFRVICSHPIGRQMVAVEIEED